MRADVSNLKAIAWPGLFFSLTVASICPAFAAAAENYPSRPIRWIVPFSPGGPSDIIGRFFAAKLSDALGKQVVVDNRSGATGIIAFEIAARAVPDGYTVLQAGASGLTTNPHLHAKLPYDAQRDFRLVTQLVATPNMLVVHASLPARTVRSRAPSASWPGRPRCTVSTGSRESTATPFQLF